MKTIADLLYDLSINSIKSNASILICNINYRNNKLNIELIDNGIWKIKLNKVFNYNNESMGLKLANEICSYSSGKLKIKRIKNKYTKISLSFDMNNLNTLPVGDICATLFMLSSNLDVYVCFYTSKLEKSNYLENLSESLFFDEIILNTIY